MKSSTALRALVLTFSLGLSGLAQANLLTSGSFELGNFTSQGFDTQTFTAGATTLTGWTTIGNFVSWIGKTNPYQLSAQDGDFFLDLTGFHTGSPFGGVSQTVTTTPGQQYDLSFYLGSYTARWGGPPVSIMASVAGTSQTFTDNTHSSQSTWTLEHMLFKATGSTTVITLTGTAGVEYIGLDNVSLTAVPEPSVWELVLIGFASLGLIAHARTKKGTTLSPG